MNLHKDKDAFELILIRTSEEYGYRPDILEKDYYVTLLLNELSEKQVNGLKAYFKGGTAVYKILNSLKRFSEDIDLTVDITDRSSIQIKKDLKQATKEYTSLAFVEDLINNKATRTSTFKYSSLFVTDLKDQLNRFGLVKIESTNFTISEPIEKHQIAPLIYTLAIQSDKEILEKEYDIMPFSIITISLERIFIDKLFALENRLLRKEFFDAGKHAYDVCQLFKLSEIKKFLLSRDELIRIIDIQVKEEKARLNSNIHGVYPTDFGFKVILDQDSEFISEFNDMQRVYVFNNNDTLELNMIIQTLNEIRTFLFDLRGAINANELTR